MIESHFFAKEAFADIQRPYVKKQTNTCIINVLFATQTMPFHLYMVNLALRAAQCFHMTPSRPVNATCTLTYEQDSIFTLCKQGT